MKKTLYISIIIVVLFGGICCKQKKTNKPYIHPDNLLKEIETQHIESEKAKQEKVINYKNEHEELISIITDSCDCHNYHGMKKITSKKYGNLNYLLCGYNNRNTEEKPSYLLSGYTLFECNHLKSIISEGSEINSDLIEFGRNGISITRQDLFPINGQKGMHEVPVFRIRLIQTEFDISMDTSFVLNIEGIELTSYEQFYKEYFLESNMEMPKQIDPELEVLYEFLKTVKNYPEGIEDFKTREVFGAATREYYFELLRYLKVYKN